MIEELTNGYVDEKLGLEALIEIKNILLQVESYCFFVLYRLDIRKI